MHWLDFFLIYVFIGVISGTCFEYLMYVTNLNKGITIFERFTWVIFWPLYVLVFLIGMKK